MNDENQFIPEVGVLISRFLIGLNGSAEIDICFRDNPNNERHYQNVCRIFWGVSERYFSGCIDTCTGFCEQGSVGNNIVVRTYCSRETLNMFVRLYPEDKRDELVQWYREVSSEYPNLQNNQKERIKKALENFGVLFA